MGVGKGGGAAVGVDREIHEGVDLRYLRWSTPPFVVRPCFHTASVWG